MKIYNHLVKDYGQFSTHFFYSNSISYDFSNRSIKRNSISNSINSSNSSFNRTKTKIIDYIYANDWDYFVTLTFNKDLIDRYSLDTIYSKISKKLNNIRNRIATEMKYILIPEYHKDNAIHFHALFKNIDQLEIIKTNIKINNRVVYNIKQFDLGFNSAIKIDNIEKTKNYILKYLTKENLSLFPKNRNRYLKSNNLNLPKIFVYFYDPEVTQEVKKFLLDHSSFKTQYNIKIKNIVINNVEKYYVS